MGRANLTQWKSIGDLAAKSPIHFHWVLHAKRGQIQIACKIVYTQALGTERFIINGICVLYTFYICLMESYFKVFIVVVPLNFLLRLYSEDFIHRLYMYVQSFVFLLLLPTKGELEHIGA